MASLPRWIVVALVALPLLAALAPCPSELAGGPDTPRLERFCPCGCTPAPATSIGAVPAALPPALPGLRLPALCHDTPAPVATIAAGPPRPIDHVPQPA